MVYSGPPSKACLSCRNRRIKCDLAIPECKQCSRAGRVCEGYRNQLDLLFRDQTQMIAGKAQGLKQRTTQTLHTQSGCVGTCNRQRVSTTSSRTRPSATCQPQCPLAWCPSTSQDDYAACFFFSNYSRQSSEQPQRLYEHLPMLYTDREASHLPNCIITAIGLAGLAHRKKNPDMLVTAETCYDSALRQTNHALQDPQTACSDQVLVSVLLLGVYETNNRGECRSTTNWLKHVQGASTLLGLRGKQQLSTELGRRLFEDVRIQILTLCSLTRTPIPQAVLDLSNECWSHVRDPADELVLISTDFWKLRSERPFHPRSSDSETVDREIVFRCTPLLAELIAWRLHLDPGSSPRRVSIIVPRSDVLRGYYDVYEDAWTAALLNQYHRLSLLVQELAVTRLLNLQRKHLLSLNETLQIADLRIDMIAHIEAICASVPYVLETGRIEGGRSLLWPLYICGQLNPKTLPMESGTRDWIVGRLSAIGSGMGVRQALFLKDVLVSQQEVTEVLTQEQD
ncbi:hypothetical protein EDD36DRAFT_103910 [Exophiala viscosa]|uniref:Zn(2)-C6 fungal-type domain-containing protein n=1 Tax=Exophiala viscosa TaxID=2486360 RepID=A0AAN6DLM4_9EURO|nr:hypothetical protein EDD36DRAFT_103910 [Exophiala viscosa]